MYPSCPGQFDLQVWIPLAVKDLQLHVDQINSLDCEW